MYKELGVFSKTVLRQKSMWRDGDLWTAVAAMLAAVVWFQSDPMAISRIRAHFGDLLGATSIVFGFALTALSIFVQGAGAWGDKAEIKNIAQKVVDWHIWTVVSLLVLIGYLLVLWAFFPRLETTGWIAIGLFAGLVFGLVYCGCQILNHALTIWWAFCRNGILCVICRNMTM